MTALDALGKDVYAGFWRRAGGYVLDTLIFYAFYFLLFFVFGIALAAQGGISDTQGFEFGSNGAAAGLSVAAWLAWFLYDTILTSRFGWTLGKRAVGVEVRDANGELISYGRAVGRFFARIISAVPLLLGFFWAGWDGRKQTWHDKIASTYVVLRERVGQPAFAGRPAPYSGWGVPRSGSGSTPQTGGWAATAAPGPQRQPPPSPPVQPQTMESAQWSSLGAGAARPADPPPPREPAPPPTTQPAEPEPPGPAPIGQPSMDQPSMDQPLMDQPSLDQPSLDQPPMEEPSMEPEPTEQSPREQSPGEQHAPSAEPPAAEPPPPPERLDPNLVAITRASIPHESSGWLQQVADQVDARLDRINPEWRESPHAEAARACAFGILIGHLATTYPHMEDDLSGVAEAHPSFSTLPEGSRLTTLQQIAGDLGRATAWLGPLIRVDDREHLRRLLD